MTCRANRSDERDGDKSVDIERQSEIDKALQRAYYGDLDAFNRVRAFIAAKETKK